jgi:hypothetical protein
MSTSDYKKRCFGIVLGHENHLLGETNFDANGKCTMQDEKVRIFQLEMVLSSRSKDTVRNSLTLF